MRPITPRRVLTNPAAPALLAIVSYGALAMLVGAAPDAFDLCYSGDGRLFAVGVALLAATIVATAVLTHHHGHGPALWILAGAGAGVATGLALGITWFAVTFSECFVF